MLAITASGGAGGGGAAGDTSVNGCDEAATATSPGDVSITFPMGGFPVQYSPPCVKIHRGASVTWNGSFTNHPLVAEGAHNPIMSLGAGGTF